MCVFVSGHFIDPLPLIPSNVWIPATGWQQPAMAAAKVFPPKSCRDLFTPGPSSCWIHGGAGLFMEAELWLFISHIELGYILTWIFNHLTMVPGLIWIIAYL